MINAAADQITIVRAAVAELGRIRALFAAANPSTAGTPLDGNTAALNSAFTALKAESDKPVWTALIAAKVPSHRGRALEE